MDNETSSRPNVDLLERMLIDETAQPTHVSLSLLENITNCFSDDQRIGSGGFAVVYKGILGKGMIAVKKLIKFDLPEKKFHREVECLMKAKHRNIVRFLGYCSESHGRMADYKGKLVMSDIRNWLLCFEYVPNGTLDNYITDASCGLDWMRRYEIIKGICEGLLHLHQKRILHLDLKPSNILLDEHMVPKITDFGLSMCLDEDQTRAFTLNLCGSLGYLPPEFFRGQLGFASDIYSLGVIIVEILTGEKGYPEDENVVANWMSRLEGSDQRDTQLEQVRVCTKIGIECMALNPKKRPAARHIIDRLDKTIRTVEIGISSSSFKLQGSFVTKQYCQEKIATPLSEYLRNDIKEHTETEQLAEYDGTSGEDHWPQGQEEAEGGEWSLSGVQDTEQNVSPQGASISGSKSGVLNRLKNLLGRKRTNVFMKQERTNILTSMEEEEFAKWTMLRRFRHSELAIATNSFSNENKIGLGGFWSVYHGYLKETDVHVAVKRVHKSKQGKKECIVQVSILGQLRHRNLVQLLGWCHDGGELLLVYELMPNGSLDTHIHSKGNVLPWSLRHEIVLDVGSVLVYLHEDWKQCVLHRDIKPSNLMLDASFKVKLGHFGLAKLVDHGQRAETTMLAGTNGYIDPETMVTGRPSKESDVYSFGVAVLEIITGRPPSLVLQENRMHLVQFVWELYGEGRILDAIDARPNDAFNSEDMERMMVAALWCVQPHSSQRPSIRKALNVMRCEAPLPILPVKMPVATFVKPIDTFLSPFHPDTMGTSGGSSYATGTTRSSTWANTSYFSEITINNQPS